jgi:signal transduction histidine kinase
MGSIQERLTVYIVVGTAGLLIIAGIAVDHMIRRQLASDFDQNLLYEAMGLVRLADREDRVIEFDFSYDYMPEFDALENKKMEYFQLSFPDGTTFAKSRSLGAVSLPRASSRLETPSYRDVLLPDGHEGRMVSFIFAPEIRKDNDEDVDAAGATKGSSEKVTLAKIPDSLPTDTGIRISVAKGRESLVQVLDTIRITLVSTCLALMAAVWLLVRYCVQRGLGPLRRIADEVRSLDSTKLNTQLATDPKSEELKPITDQLNHLLERLHDAFEREKRFSGNVAHELRTPIAELRTLAEVGKRWPGDQGMVAQFFGDLVNLADDMERTVTNLLSLARLDAGQHSVDLDSVNLSGLIEKCWKQTAVEAELRKIGLDNRIESELRVTTDEDKLNLIVVNLFSNAVSYSPPGSTIVVEAREADSGIQFSVSNLTVDLTERDLPLMFDRFWRKDKARTKGRYAGLGLSLVQALGEILDLRVMPELDPNGTLTMTLQGFEPA